MIGEDRALALGRARRAIGELLTGDQRASSGLRGDLASALDASPARSLEQWLAREASDSIDVEHRRLLDRLRARGVEIPNVVRPLVVRPPFLDQFDEGFEGIVGAGILRGVRARDGEEVSLTGVLGGARLDAFAAWMLATSVLTSAKARPERPIVIVLESSGSADTMDESTPLSEYLAHLARAIAWVRSQAVAVNVWIVGAIDVASYAACAAAAARVVAFQQAALYSAPASHDVPDHASAHWVASGVVDELADGLGRVAIAWNVSA